jgi:uncharacterized membrane protein YidH (DUF202 family)
VLGLNLEYFVEGTGKYCLKVLNYMEKDMHNKSIQDKSTEISNIRDHLANERTFLAWIRTSLGIMAFGFVVEKFSLFLKQIAYFLGVSQLSERGLSSSSLQGYSSIFGILLVAFGTLMSVFAFIKFNKINKQIKENTYKTSIILDLLLTLSVLLIGILLVIYLLLNNFSLNK